MKVNFTPFWSKYKSIGTGVWKNPFPEGLDIRSITNEIALSARGPENQELDNGLENSVINFVHIWS